MRSELRPETDLSTGELFRRVMADLRSDDDERLGALVALCERPTREVIDGCIALCASSDPYERTVGLRVLRELGHPYVDEEALWTPIESIVIELAITDENAQVVRWAISCLGYKADSPAALEAVLHHAHHPDGWVRCAVAAALPALAGSGPDAEAVTALLALAEDEEADVRSYALMGLADDLPRTEVIERTLLAHVTDPDEQIRNICQRAVDPTTSDSTPAP